MHQVAQQLVLMNKKQNRTGTTAKDVHLRCCSSADDIFCYSSRVLGLVTRPPRTFGRDYWSIRGVAVKSHPLRFLRMREIKKKILNNQEGG